MKYNRKQHETRISNSINYLRVLSLSIALTLGFWLSGELNSEVELISPMAAPVVFAKSVEEVEFSIEGYILEVFGEDGEMAVRIATCESKLRPEVIGDKDLMSINTETGELVGDSIGIFQIRTGSTNWNRAARNDMTADEFRTFLKDPINNINYAKTIFDRQGFMPWTCRKWI